MKEGGGGEHINVKVKAQVLSRRTHRAPPPQTLKTVGGSAQRARGVLSVSSVRSRLIQWHVLVACAWWASARAPA